MTTRRNKLLRFCSFVVIVTMIVCSYLCLFDFTPSSEVQVAEAADYYAGLDTTQTGTSFRAALKNLISNTHTTLTTYGGLGSVYPKSDADPNTSGNILLFYTGTSVKYSGGFSGQVNREHVWPKDAGRAFDAESNCGSDAHHLRPCDQQLNSTRSSNSFDEVPKSSNNIVKEGGSTSYANLCYQSGGLFYPGEGYRGATARILMYVETRWGDRYSLYFVDSAGNCKSIGKISTLLKWHYEEPPTAEEIARNEEVFKIQGNRNPFIDHPEYATKIYCYDGKNYNSKLQQVAQQYDHYDTDVDDDTPIESISISPKTSTLAVGENATLTVSATPSNASRSVTWTTSNSSVATVANGVLTAVGAGTATITATSVKDHSKTATMTVTVKAITAISLSGEPTVKDYFVGDPFNPTGLTVTATYSDGSSGTIPNANCSWLGIQNESETLTYGTDAIICKVGSLSATYTGITVRNRTASTSKTITVTRDSFQDSGAYGWHVFTDNGVSGKGYIYGGNKTIIQINSNKTSYYFFNTTPLTGVTSIRIKTNSDKNFDVLTSATPYGEVSGIPSNGTSLGEKTASASGVIWTVNTTDQYFAIVYKSTGAAYIEEIVFECSGDSSCAHNYGSLVAETPANCTSTGLKAHYVCSKCGEYFDSQNTPTTISALVIPMTDHTLGDWIIDQAPTETEEGLRHKECSTCGGQFNIEIMPAIGGTSTECVHNYGSLVAETPANCTSTGLKAHYVCSKCGKYFVLDGTHYIETSLANLTTPKTGIHVYGDEVVDVAATDTQNGSYHKDCTVCGERYAGVIPAGITGNVTKALLDFISSADAAISMPFTDKTAKFESIKDALVKYSALTDSEKSDVESKYLTLLETAKDYNVSVAPMNRVNDEAIDSALTLLCGTIAFASVALLVLKKLTLIKPN